MRDNHPWPPQTNNLIDSGRLIFMLPLVYGSCTEVIPVFYSEIIGLGGEGGQWQVSKFWMVKYTIKKSHESGFVSQINPTIVARGQGKYFKNK